MKLPTRSANTPSKQPNPTARQTPRLRFAALLLLSVGLALSMSLAPTPLRAASDAAKNEFPPIPKKDYTPPALGPHEPELQIDYPGAATAKSITKGNAMVDVLVGADGKFIDALDVGYSNKAFGNALRDKASTLDYSPAKFRGVPIPARLVLTYQFESHGGVSKNAMDEAVQKFNSDSGVTMAVSEDKLDAPLEYTDLALPRLPKGYKTKGDEKVRVFVTFFVDEDGKVRVPNVESAASPELVAGAIKAIQLWTFKPGLVKGKPVVAYAGRAVPFLPRDLQVNKPAAPAATP
jgi:outer membrane biosynthesis protein TonB